MAHDGLAPFIGVLCVLPGTQTDLPPSFPRITPDLLQDPQTTPPNQVFPFWGGYIHFS